ncbi:DUF6056 family protein [Bifidobacterium sp. ESL0775]|uniref:DUF6056 family protein n=1 Tax=Bifidobacterium sp. ESL0775 TaxID=2983230 RepID=UPI0023F6B26D|nr:DUF6056 family protein [Bifidobacterium sp. ESL0775]WEV69551.1 DUF6056 family protein [Bifidobacterium sp. ESL0775]
MDLQQIKKATEKDGFKRAASLFACWLITFLVSLFATRISGDDALYARELSKMSGLQWLVRRYETWSGRVFSDAVAAVVVPLPQIVWRFCDALFLTLLIYSIARIVFQNFHASDILFVFALYWLLHPEMILSSTFWLAGSVVYLWPTALAVFACILLSDAVCGRQTRYKILCVIAAIFGALGVEQLAPCIIAFGVISLIYVYRQKRTLNWWVLATACAGGIGLIINRLSPGSRYRSGHEASFWYPEYTHLPMYKKIYRGIIWEYGEATNYMLALFLFLALTILVSIVMKRGHDSSTDLAVNKKNGLETCDYTLLVIVFGQLIVLSADSKMNYASVFVFRPYSNQRSALAFLYPYLFWTVFAVCIMTLLLRFMERKFTALFLVLASVCSGAIMFFSPTIYASGIRTMYVSSILIVILIALVQQQFKNRIVYIAVYIPAILNLFGYLHRVVSQGFRLGLFT